jgi:16S rRNA (uracil1498-N3)-methyltransferase
MTQKTTSPRLYTSLPLKAGMPVALETAQGHYLRNVMRLGAGDFIRLFNGVDGEFSARLETPAKKETLAIPETLLFPQPAAASSVHLIFAPIKKARLDILIEKSVELGATHLYPVLTERTESRKLNEARIEAQIIEALEQCERLEKPKLHPLQKLEKLLPAWNGPRILACLEREAAPEISAHLASTAARETAILVGPEGGFTAKEIKYIVESGRCQPVSLGPAILRAETAAFYALSLVSAYFSKSSGGAVKIG